MNGAQQFCSSSVYTLAPSLPSFHLVSEAGVPARWRGVALQTEPPLAYRQIAKCPSAMSSQRCLSCADFVGRFQFPAFADGFPQLTVESAESINTIAVVLFQTGLHKLQEPRLLCVLYCQNLSSRSHRSPKVMTSLAPEVTSRMQLAG